MVLWREGALTADIILHSVVYRLSARLYRSSHRDDDADPLRPRSPSPKWGFLCIRVIAYRLSPNYELTFTSCVYCVVVLYFAYQCFFDDLLSCCKTCAIDIGLLKTTYLLTYLLTFGLCYTGRRYAERGIATANRLSVCPSVAM